MIRTILKLWFISDLWFGTNQKGQTMREKYNGRIWWGMDFWNKNIFSQDLVTSLFIFLDRKNPFLNPQKDYVIEFDIHHPALKEIPTEIKLRSPVLLDVPEFFIIRDKSDLDENFPASIRLRDGTLLAVKSVSSWINKLLKPIWIIQEIVHHKPELQEFRVRIRIPTSELFQIPKTVNLYSPSILQIDKSFNLNPLGLLDKIFILYLWLNSI